MEEFKPRDRLRQTACALVLAPFICVGLYFLVGFFVSVLIEPSFAVYANLGAQ